MTPPAIAPRRRLDARVAAFLLAALMLVAGMPAAEALGRLVSVIVMGRDAGTAAVEVRSNGGRISSELPIIGGVAAEVPQTRLDDLQRTALVVPDRVMRVQGADYGANLVSAYPHEVGATAMWEDGVTGAGGPTVAVLDTGVADHPDLAGRVVGRVNITRERHHRDGYGHGTFMAGIIAGNGASSDGRYVGVAPEVNVFAVKVANHEGTTSLAQVLMGIQAIDSMREVHDIRVMLLALSSDSPLPPDMDPLSVALRKAWAHGIVVVVPAGNSGPDEGSIDSPGEDPVLLTAASVDDKGTPDVSDDTVSEFSGRGPTRWGDEKPDLAAPGEAIVSLRSHGSSIDESYPNARIEDDYFRGSGTSMSSAVTAGAAALLLTDRPDLSPDDVKAFLMASANPIPGGDFHSVGAGVVDAAAASTLDAGPLDLPPAPELDDDPPVPGLAVGADGEVRANRDHAEGSASASAFGAEVSGEAQAGAGGNGSAGGAEAGADADELHEYAPEARRWAARQWKDDVYEARRWAARRWAARRWAARRWAARRWAIAEWTARQWRDAEWDARRWDARRWGARRWDARRWDARRWGARQWAARQWRENEWSARQWRDDAWAARQWAARQWRNMEWDARQWRDEAWNARQWSARQWHSDQWAARQWSDAAWEARQWSARQWAARQWAARQWSARQWAARQWAARQWAARQWAARQWAARQWSARQWTTAGWG